MTLDINNTKKIIVFIFEIRNQFDDFAECSKFINIVNNKETIKREDFKNLPKIFIDEEDINESNKEYKRIKHLTDCEEYIIPSIEELTEYIKNSYQKAFHFFINIDEQGGDDIVNFQYYFLIKQMYPDIQRRKGFSLLISSPKFTSTNPLLYKIGQFLSLEINISKDPNCIYCYQENRIQHLPYSRRTPKNIRHLSRFFPLLEINSESFNILSMPIRNLIKFISNDKNCNSLIEISTDSIFQPQEDNKQGYNLPFLLYSNTISFLSTSKRKEQKSFFFQKDFFNLIKDLPLLTLMLFAVSINVNNDLIKNIPINIYEATDYAEGILQLLENVVEHSQNKSGYFCFRLHSLEIEYGNKINKLHINPYLDKEYHDYITFLRNSKKHYDEIKSEFPKEKFYEKTSKSTPKSESKENHQKIISNTRGDLSYQSQKSLFIELFVIDSRDPSQDVILNDKKSPVINVFIENVQKRIKDNNETDLTKFLPELENVQLHEFFCKGEHLSNYELHYSNITRHYGIKRFANSVSASKGFFLAISTYKFIGVSEETYYQQDTSNNKQNPKQLINKKNIRTIPGTRYQVLLPINHQHDFQQKFVGIDTDYKWVENFDAYLFNKWKIINISLMNSSDNKNDRIQSNSQIIINSILENINTSFDKVIPIYLISVPENHLQNDSFSAELASKAILHALASDKIKDLPKIAFIVDKCPKYFIPEFVHNIMIAYDRFNVGRREIMENRQIYCSGIDEFDDFLIIGKDLKELRKHMVNRSTLRGAFPSFLFLLNYILEKQDVDSDKNVPISRDELPFDLILSRDNKTLFQKRTEKILLRQIYEDELGCSINNSHIQVGSKIHIHNFYDADILFQSNYFTTRFAALLAKEIHQKIYIDKENKTVLYKLVGYGNYSDVVINQTQKFLERMSDNNKLYKLSSYSIVNQEDDHQELINQNIETQQNEKYIFIVPINSTLTTHNKLHSRFIEFSNCDESKVLGNYALVLVRDKIQPNLTEKENIFWSRINNNEIITRLLDSPVKYFIEVPGEWENPLNCPMCFPNQDYYNEKPIIETNITSIIPMLQLEDSTCSNSRLDLINIPKNVEEIASVATYKHIKRGENHFLFYFSNKALYKNYKTNIEDWLKEVRKNFSKPRIQSYNFIVTPLNDSNSDFVDSINSIIFNNSAQILRFEIDREYRSNFCSKYSYITELSENLHQTNKIWPILSGINFFFVDEGIISGRTISRAKSLINSLFPQSCLDVNISIFEGIFVLVNRLSKDSIRNYISNINKYYYYSNFPISSIRNSSDFCYLCKKSTEGRIIANSSALNDLQKEWNLWSNKFTPLDSHDLVQNRNQNEKSKDRVIYAAKLANLLNNHDLVNNQITRNAIISLLLKEIAISNGYKEDQEEIVLETNDKSKSVLESLLKLLARPFFIYKYSTRKALLQILLTLLDIFIASGKNNFSEIKKYKLVIKSNLIKRNPNELVVSKINILKNWIKTLLFSSKENRVWLFNLLIEQFTEINSSRLIRKDFLLFINHLLDQDWFLKINDRNESSCYLMYRKAIDQILNLNRDESKSIWLEYLLVTGQEIQQKQSQNDMLFISTIWNSKNHLGIGLYLENTKVFRDALNYLAKPGRTQKNVIDPKDYYLDNFRKLLEINNVVVRDSITKKWKFSEYTFQKKQTNEKSFSNYHNQSFLDFNSQYKQMANGTFHKKNEPIELRKNNSSINDETTAISFKIIIQSMIEFERFIETKLKESTKENSEIFIENFKVICEKINSIACANYTEIILVPSKSNVQRSSNLVLARSFNKLGLQNTRLCNNDEIFDDKSLIFNTYQLLQDRLLIKVYDGNNQNIFLVIYYCPNNNYNGISEKYLKFTLRNLLLFRGKIKSLIEKHLNGNSLQSWALAEQERLLLLNRKNSRHNVSHDIEKSINKYIMPEEGAENKYYQNLLQAMVLQLMADINISSIYHDTILVGNQQNYYQEHRINEWKNSNIIKTTFKQEVIEALIDLINCGKRNILCNLPDIDTISSYYLVNSGEEFLLLISLIENAIKFSPEGSQLILDYSNSYIKQESNRSTVGYFCITNKLPSVYQSEANRNQLKKNLKTYFQYPVEDRWIESDKYLNSKTGISLYAANYYCRRVLMGLNLVKLHDTNTVVKYNIFNKDNEDSYFLEIMVPILHIRKEEK